MNRKASVRDVALMVVIVFILAAGFLIFHKTANDVIDKMQNTSIIRDVPAANATLEIGKTVTNRMDWLIIVVYIGFIIGLIITGFMIETHPIFFVLYLIMLVIAIALAAIMGHMWYLTSSTSSLSATATSHFSITDFFMGKFPLFTAVGGLVGLIVMYAKGRRQE